MKTDNIALKKSIEAIIFDCDGTLSHIEGIDELATQNGVGDQVSQLTAAAMGQTGLNPQIYHQRLNLVSPTSQQVLALGDLYYQQITPDLQWVLSMFASLGKSVYIVSAGLSPAVIAFGKRLGISEDCIFAVNIFFTEQGHYFDFDRHSPLVHASGKRQIVQELKKRHQELAFVGDGLNDLTVADLVSRFIGYGGAYYRKNIEEQCRYYISTPSLRPLVDLCLTPQERTTLNKK